MNDKDFIKKCCEFADGFEWLKPDQLGMPHGTWTVNSSCKDNPSWNFLIYPLLLQRAIETIEDTEPIKFTFMENGAKTFRFIVEFQFTGKQKISGWIYPSIDSAKITALKYVFEKIEDE